MGLSCRPPANVAIGLQDKCVLLWMLVFFMLAVWLTAYPLWTGTLSSIAGSTTSSLPGELPCVEADRHFRRPFARPSRAVGLRPPPIDSGYISLVSFQAQ